MKKQKFVLVSSLPLDIISGGNVYNQNLCNAFGDKGIEIETVFTQNVLETISKIDDNTIILLDSYCLNEKVNWALFLDKKIIILLHLAPSADDQKDANKLFEINETEKIVFTNFPILSAGNKAIEYIEEKYHLKISNFIIVPPAIRPNWMKKQTHKQLPQKLLVIGTITQRKGYERLIKTLVLLKENDWTCDCYGSVSDDILMQELITTIKENKLDNRVRFCGTIDNSTMDILQNQYDLLLQLSDEENNSVTLIEAIASGLPFVSTPTGNHHYFSANNCGCIVSSFDEAIIADTIKKIVNNSNMYKNLVQSLDKIPAHSWNENIENILTFTNKLWQ